MGSRWCRTGWPGPGRWRPRDQVQSKLLTDPGIHGSLQLAYGIQDNTVAILMLVRGRINDILRLLAQERASSGNTA